MKNSITPYKYRFDLELSEVEKFDGRYIIYLDRKQRLVDDNLLEFQSITKLTKEEALLKLKGTKGIISLTGNFKEKLIMNKKNTVSTLNAPNLTDKRRDGNTTRQINYAIEQLLQGKTVICVDHAAPHYLEAGLLLARAIKRRLFSEHDIGTILNKTDDFYYLDIPAVQLNAKNTIIKVPDNIKFVQLGTKIYLVSPNQKLMMSMGAYKDRPSITFIQDNPDIPNYVKDLYLVPCKREDLQPGDFAFRTYWNKPTFLGSGSYCVILKNEEYSYFNNAMDVFTKNSKYTNWYKIVKESDL